MLPLCAHGIRVRLLVNRQTQEAVAVKVIDTSQAKECAENVKKEVCIHKVGHSASVQTIISVSQVNRIYLVLFLTVDTQSRQHCAVFWPPEGRADHVPLPGVLHRWRALRPYR